MNPKTIETKITIDASVKETWKVLTNFDLYPEWSSTLQIKGRPLIGNRLVVSIALQKNNKPMQFKPAIVKCTPEHELKWIGKLFNLNGFFVGEHYFQLHQTNPEQTELIHGEIFKGILVPFLWPMLGEKTHLAFEDFNKELKDRVLEQVTYAI